jgi:olfactory receptor
MKVRSNLPLYIKTVKIFKSLVDKRKLSDLKLLIHNKISVNVTGRYNKSQKSAMRNNTVTTFILMGLTDNQQLQVLIFIFIFLTYTLSVTGNLAIVSLILVDSHLKTAMYYFLQNFAFLEISFTSACIPRYLYNIATGDKMITYNACVTQVFFTDLFSVTEFFLLVAMSYDRYVAICRPLHYMTIMNSTHCRRLVFCCWVAGLCILIPPLSLGLKLEFCALTPLIILSVMLLPS